MPRFWRRLVCATALTATCLGLFSTATQAIPSPSIHEATLACADQDHSGGTQAELAQSGEAEEQEQARPKILGESEPDADLNVAINRIIPAVLTDEEQVQLNITVTNTSDQEAQNLTLTVGMQAGTPITTEQLTRFLTGETGEGATVAQVEGPERLAPGAQWNTVITVARENLPLGTAFRWGPRGISVQAANAEGHLTGTGRSLIVWDSDYPVETTHIGALVPFTQETGNVETSTLSRLVSTPGVTTAVDAALLEPTRLIVDAQQPMSGTETGDATPVPTPSNPVDVITDVQQILLTQSNELAILPAQDADMGVLAASGAQDLNTIALDSITNATQLREALLEGQVVTLTPDTDHQAQPSSTPSASPSSDSSLSPTSSTEETAPGDVGDNQAVTPVAGQASPMITNLIWPSAHRFGLQVLQDPNAIVVAPPGALSPSEDVTFTSVSPVRVDPETGTTALPETQGTKVLTSLDAFAELLMWDPQSAADQFLVKQTLNAVSAIITKEKPNQSRTLLAVVPRGTKLNQALMDRLSALLSARWVTPVSVSEVASSEVTDVDRGVVGDAEWNEQDQTAMSTIQNATNRLFKMADTATDPETVRQEVNDQVLKAVSISQSSELAANATQLNALAIQWYSQVKVEPTTTVNLINKTAQFPVRVTNHLAWDVLVQVTLDPEDRRLSAQPSQVTQISAGQTVTIDVPVRAIGSGNISVGYLLTTADGFTIDQSQSVIVRLRAGWEDRFTLIIAIVVGLMFVAGVARTVRQRINHGSTIVGTPQISAHTLIQPDARENQQVKEDYEPQ